MVHEIEIVLEYCGLGREGVLGPPRECRLSGSL